MCSLTPNAVTRDENEIGSCADDESSSKSNSNCSSECSQSSETDEIFSDSNISSLRIVNSLIPNQESSDSEDSDILDFKSNTRPLNNNLLDGSSESDENADDQSSWRPSESATEDTSIDTTIGTTKHRCQNCHTFKNYGSHNFEKLMFLFAISSHLSKLSGRADSAHWLLRCCCEATILPLIIQGRAPEISTTKQLYEFCEQNFSGWTSSLKSYWSFMWISEDDIKECYSKY